MTICTVPFNSNVVTLKSAVKVVVLSSPAPEAVAEASNVEERLWRHEDDAAQVAGVGEAVPPPGHGHGQVQHLAGGRRAPVQRQVSLGHHVHVVEHIAGEVVQLAGLQEGGVHDGSSVKRPWVPLLGHYDPVVQLLPDEDRVEVGQPGHQVLVPVPGPGVQSGGRTLLHSHL